MHLVSITKVFLETYLLLYKNEVTDTCEKGMTKKSTVAKTTIGRQPQYWTMAEDRSYILVKGKEMTASKLCFN